MNKKVNWVTIRVSDEDKEKIQADAKNAGLDSASAYLLQLWRKFRST